MMYYWLTFNEDGYEYCGDSLIYCDSYRDALMVMREAEKVN